MNRTFGRLAVLALFLSSAAAQAASQSALVKVDLQRRPLGTFYVGGEIRGHGPVDLLVDTGSSVSVINEVILRDLQAAHAATFSRNLEGRMADGSTKVVPVYRIAELRLGDRCVLQDVEAAVFADNTRPILGMDLLTRLAPFTFSADPPGLEFQACETVARPLETEAMAATAGVRGGLQ